MATPKTYNFPKQYKGDTFFPSVDGSDGGLVFRIKETNTDNGYDGIDITIQFKLKNGYLGKKITTEDGITRLNNGYYRIDSFIIEMYEGTYQHDWEFVYPDNNVITAVRGQMLVEKDISNA